MVDAVRLRIVLVALAGWVNRHQLEIIEYLREENRVLKEHLDERSLRLTESRRRLAVNGHRLLFTFGGGVRKSFALILSIIYPVWLEHDPDRNQSIGPPWYDST